MTDKEDGVAKYRRNDRSVEGLTKEELEDILNAYPRSSDAHTDALNQLYHLWEIENEYEEIEE